MSEVYQLKYEVVYEQDGEVRGDLFMGLVAAGLWAESHAPAEVRLRNSDGTSYTTIGKTRKGMVGALWE